MIMLSHANLLVLDEPTNHLDVESIEALEDAIGAYNGTVILVSHDRELLRALTTRIWALDRGRIEDFAGGFADWEVATAERASQAEARTQSGTSQKSGAGSERRSPDAQRSKNAQRPLSAGRQSRRRASARELEAAEAAVMTLESRASELTLRLADPALYSERARATDVAAVDAELRLVRAQLADAMARWERAMEEDDTGQ
jgi:ATP-binding cassette subfamily F protein 3